MKTHAFVYFPELRADSVLILLGQQEISAPRSALEAWGSREEPDDASGPSQLQPTPPSGKALHGQGGPRCQVAQRHPSAAVPPVGTDHQSWEDHDEVLASLGAPLPVPRSSFHGP